jgi:inosine/xanthosine triphosphate pyrophosphatase family protein
MTMEEKNAISHRGKAFREFAKLSKNELPIHI